MLTKSKWTNMHIILALYALCVLGLVVSNYEKGLVSQFAVWSVLWLEFFNSGSGTVWSMFVSILSGTIVHIFRIISAFGHSVKFAVNTHLSWLLYVLNGNAYFTLFSDIDEIFTCYGPGCETGSILKTSLEQLQYGIFGVSYPWPE